MGNRKPHLLRAKQEIVSILDAKIADKRRRLIHDDDRRDLAIFIRQRNKIAKEADIEAIPVTDKDLQGNYVVGG